MHYGVKQNLLADELKELVRLQSEARKNATFLNMSRDEAKEYDRRALRIKELSTALGIFQLEP